MQGLHLTADLYQCACQADLLIKAETIAQMCRNHTIASGLTLVDEKWVTFPDYQGQPGGVTGMLLLAESHLAVHTWPEHGGITLDVYVCNFSEDNSEKAENLVRAIMDEFMPKRSSMNRLWRGDEEGSPNKASTIEGTNLALENLNSGSLFGFRVNSRQQLNTGLQKLEILETPLFGKVLRLDDSFMTSEGEEFFYHEALIHPATLTHPKPEKALIIGGGDGGAAEELLKHESISQIVIAELDPVVIETAKAHFGTIHQGALDNPKVTVQIGDGVGFMRQTQDRYDLVFMDLTDPDTPAESLYSKNFFTLAQRVMTEESALVLHLGSPVFHQERVREIVADLCLTFKIVRCYGLYIPLYGAYWGMAVASDKLDAKTLSAEEAETRLIGRGIKALDYYNAEVHPALFALPNYYQRLLKN